jgi:PEGA domain
MRKTILLFAALPVFASALLAAQQPPKQEAQQFTVLRSSHMVASSESLTNAEANCAIVGASSTAAMQCRPSGGSAKSSYNFNTMLVVDNKGMAYVIACRITLVYFWCKSPAAGKVLLGTVNQGNLAIEDGSKLHDYQVLTSQYVGPLPQSQPPPITKVAPVSSGPVATPPASSSDSKKAAENGKEPSSDAAAACMSQTGACVTFASDPQGADIYVDGKFMGNTPSMLVLVPGGHEIRIEAARLKPWTRSFEASAGSKVTIQAPLEALPPQN